MKGNVICLLYILSCLKPKAKQFLNVCWNLILIIVSQYMYFYLIFRKDVSLRAYDVAFARYLTTETRPDTKVWKVSATLFLDVKEYVTGTLSATLFLNDTDHITYDRQVSISPQHNSTSLVFSVSKVSTVIWNFKEIRFKL